MSSDISSKYNIIDDIDIPDTMQQAWQKTVDLMAEIIQVPAGLIMRVHPWEIEVFIRSHTPHNVYEAGERAKLNTGLYCETVMDTQRELLVANALQDPLWDHNPDISLGMVSYCGLPLVWPDGRIFGTICILDARENRYKQLYRRLLEQFRDSVQLGLQMVYENQMLQQTQQALERSNAQLTAANAELEAFTYAVSHDLRAPLRALDGFSEALLEDYGDKLDDSGKTYLRYLREGSQDMSRLIDGLLTLSRSTRGELEYATVDLSALAEEVLHELRANEPQRQVVCRVTPRLQAHGDRRLLKTALRNLLGNAWKYTANRIDACIEFSTIQKDGKIVYCISDNGAGFDMTYADKLFQPFQRLHKNTEFSGMGIGLATVQRIIHRHGGTIRGEGAPGKGAKFFFTL